MCRFSFETLVAWTFRSSKKLSWENMGQDQRFRGSIATLINSGKHEYWGFGMLAEVKAVWPIAKSIRGIILMLMAMLKSSKTFGNEFPNIFWGKDTCFPWFSEISMGHKSGAHSPAVVAPAWSQVGVKPPRQVLLQAGAPRLSDVHTYFWKLYNCRPPPDEVLPKHLLRNLERSGLKPGDSEPSFLMTW